MTGGGGGASVVTGGGGGALHDLSPVRAPADRRGAGASGACCTAWFCTGAADGSPLGAAVAGAACGVEVMLGVGVTGATLLSAVSATAVPAPAKTITPSAAATTGIGRRYQAGALSLALAGSTGSGSKSSIGRAMGATRALRSAGSGTGSASGARSGTSGASDQARATPVAGACSIGATGAASTTGAGAIAVALSSAGPRAARSAPPIAPVRLGRGVVITGTRRCSDRVVVMTGMAAPPPIEATAARSAGRTPARSMVSCRTATNSDRARPIASSSSVRVSRTSPRKLGSSAGKAVTVTVDSRSLAARH